MSTPRPSLLLLAALVIVAAIYAPVLSGPFLWDDRHLIVHSALVRELAPLGDYFRLPFWSGAETGPATSFHYRPLTVLTLALDRRLHLDNPGGFHLTNLLLHTANVTLVFALGRQRGASGLASAVAAAAFGLLPRLCEAAAWISGRTDLLAALFVLLALWVSNRAGRLWPWTAALCLLLGLFSKEVAIAGVAALAARSLLATRSLGTKSTLERLIPLALALVVYGSLRTVAKLNAPSLALDTGDRLLTALEAVGRYFVMTIDPWQPRTQIGQALLPSLPFAALGALVLGAFVFVIVRWRRTFRAESWPFVVLGLASIGLVLHVIPLSIGVVAADRFLYLPMAALLVLLAPRLDSLFTLHRAFVPVVLALLGTLGARATSRVADFTSEARFWYDALETTPATNSLPAVEFGGVYYRAALYEKALASYRRGASAPGAEKSSALANVAICLSRLGAYDEARTVIGRAIKARPDVPKNWLDRALIELSDLEFQAARAAAARALLLYPDYAQARDVIALSSELEGQAPRVLARSDSPDPALRYAEARFFTRAGRHPDALRAWQDILSTADLDEGFEGEAWEYLARFGDAISLWEGRRRVGGLRWPRRLESAIRERAAEANELEQIWKRAGLRR